MGPSGLEMWGPDSKCGGQRAPPGAGKFEPCIYIYIYLYILNVKLYYLPKVI